MSKVNITTPVGRIVQGSLYVANTKDPEGKPLVIKTGPNAGQPRSNFYFALAIPKAGESHWAHVAWGRKILEVGAAAFPQAYQSPSFAWKIEDGDSQIPNRGGRGKKPADNEGWPGHWVLKLSGGFAPKVYRQENGAFVLCEDEYVKPGYFVEVAITCGGNESQSQPGVYLNHQLVNFRAYGPEIVFGLDVNAAGFGQSTLPAGASVAPPPSAIALPTVPAIGATPAGLPSPTAGAIPVLPQPQFLTMPVPSAAQPPAPASIPPAPATTISPSRTMTAKAGGSSYAAFIAGGWTDVQLIAQGYMNP